MVELVDVGLGLSEEAAVLRRHNHVVLLVYVCVRTLMCMQTKKGDKSVNEQLTLAKDTRTSTCAYMHV